MTRSRMSTRTFVHSGHCGDIISALPTIRELGGGKLVITNHHLAPHAWRPMRGEWFGIPSAYETLRPLLLSLPYITDVEWQDNPTDFTHDFRDFRRMYQPTRSLALAHAMHVGLESVDMSPWIDVSWCQSDVAKSKMSGKIAISRTTRHLTWDFPWAHCLSQYECVFIGLQQEREIFEREFGTKVDHLPTANFLEVAVAIAASTRFIGNQSCQCWIAMAMGHPLQQETMDISPDSVVPRENAVFVPCLTTKID